MMLRNVVLPLAIGRLQELQAFARSRLYKTWERWRRLNSTTSSALQTVFGIITRVTIDANEAKVKGSGSTHDTTLNWE
jgi:hypothetical protein